MARHTQATGHEAADRRQDTRFMRQALRLAARGEGFTRPNPPVGAVVVRDGRVIGRGYHRAAGLPHAEVEALNACRESARGATLYVTLEPCSTTGRTPPCTGRIVQEGLARVCIGCLDPNPRHAGRGITRLREAGIAVETGICETACRELIEPFTRHILDQRPMVTLKLALTLDGRLADRERRSKWITGETARAWVQRLRRRTDAIMVGAGTVLADDPELRCRLPGAGAAWRVVVDGTGRLPAGRRLFTDAYAARTIDLDILLYGDLVVEEEGLTLPDPDICRRPFLFLPLLDLDEHLRLPGAEKPLRELVHREVTKGAAVDVKFTQALKEQSFTHE